MLPDDKTDDHFPSDNEGNVYVFDQDGYADNDDEADDDDSYEEVYDAGARWV